MNAHSAGSMDRRRRVFPLTLALAFFFAATAWLTWPLPARMASAMNTSPDALLNDWALAWNFHILPREPLSLFDANIFFPRTDTLAYSEHLFGIALLAWPAYLLSGSHVLAYNFALIASFVLSGLGMYLLVHEVTGSRWAAAASGLAFLAAPYRFLQLLHIQLLTVQWFPFVLLYLCRFLREGRRRQLVAACLFALLQILSCNYYAIYLALALALFGLIVLAVHLRSGSLLDRRKTVALLLGAAAVALLALPFAQPYERNRAEGFYRRYEDVVQFSARPLDYLRPSTFNKVFFVEHLPRQQRSEKALFPGFTVVLLAGWGVLTGPGRDRDDTSSAVYRVVWLLSVSLIGVGLLLSFGPEITIAGDSHTLPYRYLYRHVPGFRGMRAPARLAVLVLLGLGVLSGLGLSRLLNRARRIRPWVGCAVIGVLLFEYQTYSLARLLTRPPAIPPVYQWLANQPGDFGILELPIHEDITREAIRMYFSTAHWKHLANGFSGWWPNDYWVLVGRMRHFPTFRILQYLERDVPVRYIIIHYAEYPEGERRRLQHDMERYRDRLPLRARFGTDAVHELLPEPETNR